MFTSEEKTENLLGGGTRQPKPKRRVSKWLIALIVAAILAAAAGGGYYYYVRHREEEYQELMELADYYLQTGDYENALTQYESALEIDDSQADPYIGIGEASQLNGDNAKAKETFDKLYEMTGDAQYQRKSASVLFGNSNGNITNGGNVAKLGDTTYVVNNYVNEAQIYRQSGDSLQLITTEQLQTDTPIKSLNVWGESLFYVKDGGVWSYNLDSDETSSYGMENVGQLLVYNGLLYYSTYSEDAGGGIYASSLDGKEVTPYFKNPKRIHGFIIDNGFIYASLTDPEGETAELRRITMSDKGTKVLYENAEAVINNMNVQDGKLYFSLMSTRNESLPKSLYTLSMTDWKLGQIATQANRIDAFNIGDNSIFFITDGSFYKTALDGTQPSLIGKVKDLLGESEEDSYSSGSYALGDFQANSVCATDTDVFTVSSLVTSSNSTEGLDDSIKWASYSNLTSYSELPVDQFSNSLSEDSEEPSDYDSYDNDSDSNYGYSTYSSESDYDSGTFR